MTASEESQGGSAQQCDEEDREVQGELVRRPEDANDERLGAGGLEGDDEGADGRDGRRDAVDKSGEQLPGAQSRRTGQEADDRGEGSGQRARHVRRH